MKDDTKAPNVYSIVWLDMKAVFFMSTFHRMTPGVPPAAAVTPIEVRQLVKNISQKRCKYCKSVGNERTPRKTILGEISGNTRRPQRCQTGWQCAVCLIPLCKQGACFKGFHTQIGTPSGLVTPKNCI